MSNPTDLLTAAITRAVSEAVREEFSRLRAELTPTTSKLDPNDLLNTDEAAKYTRTSKAFLARMRADEDPRGPKFHRAGRSIRYRRSDLDAWLAA